MSLSSNKHLLIPEGVPQNVDNVCWCPKRFCLVFLKGSPAKPTCILCERTTLRSLCTATTQVISFVFPVLNFQALFVLGMMTNFLATMLKLSCYFDSQDRLWIQKVYIFILAIICILVVRLSLLKMTTVISWIRFMHVGEFFDGWLGQF